MTNVKRVLYGQLFLYPLHPTVVRFRFRSKVKIATMVANRMSVASRAGARPSQAVGRTSVAIPIRARGISFSGSVDNMSIDTSRKTFDSDGDASSDEGFLNPLMGLNNKKLWGVKESAVTKYAKVPLKPSPGKQAGVFPERGFLETGRSLSGNWPASRKQAGQLETDRPLS